MTSELEQNKFNIWKKCKVFFYQISQGNNGMQIFQKQFFLKVLEAAGSGSSLRIQLFPPRKAGQGVVCRGFNRRTNVWLVIINQKIYSGSRSAGAHRRGPADLLKLPGFVSNVRKTRIQLLLEVKLKKICSNYFINEKRISL
jgi:hypothetical protein